MTNKASVKIPLMRLLGALLIFTALLLLGLLATASANTNFFNRYYSWLYTANIAAALFLMLVVGILIWMIVARVREGRFGARLLTKLAIFFALVGVLPGSMIYLVSLQFVARSIESWFNVKVETALDSGLTLARSMLQISLNDLQNKAELMTKQLAKDTSHNMNAALSAVREQFDVQDAIIVSSTGKVLAHATASAYLTQLLPDHLPTPLLLAQAQQHGYSSIESTGDSDSNGPHGELWLRVIEPLPVSFNDMSLQPETRFLQITQPVAATLATNADAVQLASSEYQQTKKGRIGLRKMYIGTLTLTLFLASFIAIMLALLLGNQLARPLLLLAQGTMEVTRGDYTPKGETGSNDELGFLTKSFNVMTRQLADARAAVESNRIALENSKAYLESVLANLTAGVFVFDHQFRLTTANPGAERIFRQTFETYLNMPLDQIPALNELGPFVKKAFADRGASSPQGRVDSSHWQRQLEIPVAGESEPLTLLVRGTRLLHTHKIQDNDNHRNSTHNVGPEAATLTGYVIVFDDISDVISAQRSIAWGEVARRLAHEIKNPLTPIQLSAERLQMKLTSKLAPTEAEFLKRSATTIINQVTAMKHLVDNFREYARTPPAVLQDLQLNDLINELITLYGIDEERGPIHVERHPLPRIKGDPVQLRQVIHNLLQNAQDAVAEQPDPYILLQTKAVEYGEPDAQGKTPIAVRMTVSDNGPGFPAKILSRAFEPYVTTKAKGTGLGLATVKKIIDEHGARIDIRNCDKNTRDKNAHGTDSPGSQVSILFLQLAQDTAPSVATTADTPVVTFEAAASPLSLLDQPTQQT